MKKPPCRGCEDRHAGCHGSCEAYKGWKGEREEEKSRALAERRAYQDFRKYQIDNINAIKKKQGKKWGK